MAARTDGPSSVNAITRLFEQAFDLELPKLDNGNALPLYLLERLRFSVGENEKYQLVSMICTVCGKDKNISEYGTCNKSYWRKKPSCLECNRKYPSQVARSGSKLATKEELQAVNAKLEKLLELLGEKM